MVGKININGDNGSNSLQGTDAAEIMYGFTAHPQGASIQATKIGSHKDSLPLALTAPPNDPDHLFVVEQKGVVKVLELTTGRMLASPFMDISSETPVTGEQGMLGFAFDPNYVENGHVYVYMSTMSNDVEVRRYTVSANDPLVIDPSGKHVVKKIDFPDGTDEHRAGWIGFGPDGYLYVNVGDAENGNNAQKLDNPFGKILRLDVNGDAFPDDPDRNYLIPSDNPATIAGAQGDASGTGIFAAGFRNPWKGSFDRATGEFYVSDVGTNKYEEINLIRPGANYGWSQTEGPFDPATNPDFTNPIRAYAHGTAAGVVGGYVYRGQEDAFHGQYFFGDFQKSKVWTMGVDGGSQPVTDVTADIKGDLARFGNPGVFGEDALGNLYVATFAADIIKLTPQTASLDQADVLDGAGGDDVIYAGGGDDKLLGGTGDDDLNGMVGNDVIDGGSGKDRMVGGLGDDTYVVDNVNDVVLERTGEGKDAIRTKVSYTLSDTMSVEVLWTTNTSGTTSIDLTGNKLNNQVSGNAGSNVLSGLGGADVIRGLEGNDVLQGGSGKDDLRGDDGNDRLEGGTEADKLEGGNGLDVQRGGDGADTFVWRSTTETSPLVSEADLVTDFDRAQGDLINLSYIDAREDRTGSQAFTFIGTAEFTQAGQVRYALDGGQTLVSLNTDKDAEAEGVIRLMGVHTLQADCFVP